MIIDTAAHPALEPYKTLQELSSEAGRRTLLARLGEDLVTVEILAEKAVPEEIRAALAAEAARVSRLSDETILRMRPPVLADDLAAIVTEYMEGVSLQRLLRFAASRGVRLPDITNWYLIERILHAVASAHAFEEEDAPSPIVHGGLVAASVVVGWDGTTRVRDFGLARMRELVESLRPESDELPRLMSPEQARGEATTERTDVYNLAMLAVRLGTGRTPYAKYRKAAERMLAMSDGKVARLSKTRPDLPEAARVAFDRALEADPEKRTVTAADLLAAVRESFDIEGGKAGLRKLLLRWRDPIEKAVTPWERGTSTGLRMDLSMPDDVPAVMAGVMAGALALVMPDDRPSSESLVSVEDPSDSTRGDKGSVAKEEKALAPTDVATSLSRLGSSVPEALNMPLPAIRMSVPSLPQAEPLYTGHIHAPPAKPQFFSGRIAAVTMLFLFTALTAGALILFRYLGLM